MLHLKENLSHYDVVFGGVEHVISGLIIQLVGDVFLQGGLAVFCQNGSQIEVFDHRDVFVNLRQKVFVNRCKGNTFDKFR